jgi:hypothetical protein
VPLDKGLHRSLSTRVLLDGLRVYSDSMCDILLFGCGRRPR